MTTFIYTSNLEKNRRLPYLFSLWSGYHSAALAVSAFVLLNHWLGNATAAFGALLFTSMLSLSLGRFVGRLMARGILHMKRLIVTLGTASLLSGALAVYGRVLADYLLQLNWTFWSREGTGTLVACLLFSPPLLLLSAIPPYATAMLIRRRGSAGSVNGTISAWTAFGYGFGALVTAYYFVNWMDARAVLKSLFVLSLLLTALGLLRNPPRRKPKRS